MSRRVAQRSPALLTALLTVVALVMSAEVTTGQETGPFDLLVRGGRVLDGTGNPWFRADLGIRDGRIVAVGMQDRGEIREGNWADLVVFDMETIADQATFFDPHQHATGILYALPGKVIASRRGGS